MEQEPNNYDKQNITIQTNIKAPRWSAGTAALLSFIIPGVGQMYKGNFIRGILWLILVTIGYFMLIIPGIILHVICIASAGSGNPYKE